MFSHTTLDQKNYSPGCLSTMTLYFSISDIDFLKKLLSLGHFQFPLVVCLYILCLIYMPFLISKMISVIYNKTFLHFIIPSLSPRVLVHHLYKLWCFLHLECMAVFYLYSPLVLWYLFISLHFPAHWTILNTQHINFSP